MRPDEAPGETTIAASSRSAATASMISARCMDGLIDAVEVERHEDDHARSMAFDGLKRQADRLGVGLARPQHHAVELQPVNDSARRDPRRLVVIERLADHAAMAHQHEHRRALQAAAREY